MHRCDQMTSSARSGSLPVERLVGASHTAAMWLGRSAPPGAQAHRVGHKATAVVLHAELHAVLLQQRHQRIVLAPVARLGLQVALLLADARHHADDGHARLGAGGDGRLVRRPGDAEDLDAEFGQHLGALRQVR